MRPCLVFGSPGAGLVLALVLSVRMQGVISKPILDLTAIMRAVQHGRYDVRATPTGTDEVRELMRGFNDMVAALHVQNTPTQQQHERLEAAPSAMVPAVSAASPCDHGPAGTPSHPAPGHHHDESSCSICQTIAATRQDPLLPGPVIVAVLEPRPESGLSLDLPAAVMPPRPLAVSARGPPRA